MGWLGMTSAALIAASSVPVSVPVVDEVAQMADGDDVEVLEMDRDRYDRLTVPVTIGEHGPFNFMIDTGAQATVLSRDLADKLELQEREPAILIGMASRMEIEVAAVHDLAVGNRIFDIAVAALVDQPNIGSADGILGLDSLQNQRVLLDFDKKTIAVADAKTLGGNRGYEIVVKARRELGQLIITSANLDGVRVAVIVDSGAQGSIGNPMLQKRLRSREIGTAQMTDINGVDSQSGIRLARDVRIGRARITNIPIAFADSPTFKALGLDDKPALVLGMNELKLFRRVAIDFKERKVLFDLPRGAGFTDDGPSSRINF